MTICCDSPLLKPVQQLLGECLAFLNVVFHLRPKVSKNVFRNFSAVEEAVEYFLVFDTFASASPFSAILFATLGLLPACAPYHT